MMQCTQIMFLGLLMFSLHQNYHDLMYMFIAGLECCNYGTKCSLIANMAFMQNIEIAKLHGSLVLSVNTSASYMTQD